MIQELCVGGVLKIVVYINAVLLIRSITRNLNTYAHNCLGEAWTLDLLPFVIKEEGFPLG